MPGGREGRRGNNDSETTSGEKHVQLEHETHVRHRARVPVTDGLVEGLGFLQCNEGRMAV
jgi:hypothetical protein